MPGTASKLPRYVRWSYELLFSLYTARFVVDREASKEGSKFLDWLSAPLVSSDRLLSVWRSGHLLFPRTDVHTELYFGLFCFLALILFVCLRVLSQLPLAGTLSVYVVAAAIVVGPCLMPIFGGTGFQANALSDPRNDGHLHLSRSLQLMEVVALLALVWFWRFRQWPMTILVLLFSIHFALWSLIIAGRDWWDYRSAVSEYLLLPFAAGLLWVLYGKLSAGSNRSPRTESASGEI